MILQNKYKHALFLKVLTNSECRTPSFIAFNLTARHFFDVIKKQKESERILKYSLRFKRTPEVETSRPISVDFEAYLRYLTYFSLYLLTHLNFQLRLAQNEICRKLVLRNDFTFKIQEQFFFFVLNFGYQFSLSFLISIFELWIVHWWVNISFLELMQIF